MSIIARKHLCATFVISGVLQLFPVVMTPKHVFSRIKHTHKICPEQQTQQTDPLIRILDFGVTMTSQLLPTLTLSDLLYAAPIFWYKKAVSLRVLINIKCPEVLFKVSVKSDIFLFIFYSSWMYSQTRTHLIHFPIHTISHHDISGKYSPFQLSCSHTYSFPINF